MSKIYTAVKKATVRISIVLTPEEAERLRNMARVRGVSVNKMVKDLINQ